MSPDGGDAPVIESAEIGIIEDIGIYLGLIKGEFIVYVDDTVGVKVRALCPGQAGDTIVDGQAVVTDGIIGLVTCMLGILPVKSISDGRGIDCSGIVVTIDLTRIDNRVGQIERLVRAVCIPGTETEEGCQNKKKGYGYGYPVSGAVVLSIHGDPPFKLECRNGEDIISFFWFLSSKAAFNTVFISLDANDACNPVGIMREFANII